MSEREGWLLDTNVLSETRKWKADEGMMAFLQAADPDSIFVSVLTVGELRKGVAYKKISDPVAAQRLTEWVEGLELNILGAVAGLDLHRPALNLPGLGRFGLPLWPDRPPP